MPEKIFSEFLAEMLNLKRRVIYQTEAIENWSFCV